MVCNNLEARICFAVQGIGIAYLPDLAIRHALAANTRVQILKDCSRASVSRASINAWHYG
ncbi:hypothetical protein [Pseudomonas capeferrum]